MNKNNFQKIWAAIRKIILEVAIIVGGLTVDLVSKAIVESTMEMGQTITVIPKLLNFSYTINKKAAFGSDFGMSKLFGEQGTIIFFIILTIAAVGFFGFLLFKNQKKGLLYRISFSLIIAGALGNLYDRIFLSGVRDFIQIEYLGLELFGSKTFAIFNIADSCVVIGTILLLIFIVFFDKTFKEKEENKEENSGNDAEQIDSSDEADLTANSIEVDSTDSEADAHRDEEIKDAVDN